MLKVSKKSKTLSHTEVPGSNSPAASESVALVSEGGVVESRANPGPDGDLDSSSSDSDEKPASGGDIPRTVHNFKILVRVRVWPPALFRSKDLGHLVIQGRNDDITSTVIY